MNPNPISGINKFDVANKKTTNHISAERNSGKNQCVQTPNRKGNANDQYI